MQSYLDRFATFLVFNENFEFDQKHESKLMVPNKWDNFRLNSCISIEELVKPLHKKIFSKLILLSPLLFVVIMSIYFLGIIYKMYVTIDDFVYFDHFF